MKTIGIFTLNDNLNYGNRLQNYAVQKVLMQYGLPGNMNNRYQNKSQFLKYVLWEICPVIEKLCCKKSFRIYRFLSFNRCMNYFGVHKKCDYYIYGSDQIWNPDYADDKMISPITEPNKNIAFSASVGIEEIEEKHCQMFKIGMSHFNAISVREKQAAELIKRFTDKHVHILVDPTMCVTCDEWRGISKKPAKRLPEKYLLLYFLGELSKNRKMQIFEFAANNDLQVIDLKDKNWSEMIGPSEFLYLIDHASFFLTDSFHGCVFSILFQTNFLTMKREGSDKPMNSRIDHLLSLFCLEDRKIENIYNFNIDIDFSRTDKILDNERKKVKEYLDAQLL